MSKLQNQVQALISEACRHPIGSLQRRKRLTQIIRLIADHLWRENVPHYQDALQKTWMHFCQNLCEGSARSSYDPERASVVTWLNFYLKCRIKDGYRDLQKQRDRTVSNLPAGFDTSNQQIDLIDTLPSPPDIPPMLEDVRSWAVSDVDNQLTQTHLTNHPEITCQLIILRRLPPEASWKELAAEFNVTVSTLSSFYQRKCMPLLRAFGKSQGYL